MTEQANAGVLAPYRVLDLTDERGLFCGKLLGDLGADVIKVERPGGDSARRLGPFYHDQPDPEKSLFWLAFNTSKRGVTLDIETTGGREVFRRLVKATDFVVESFPAGYLERLGLGYLALNEINPGVIVVSITPFGQTGPYRDYKAPDIVAWAMGGRMHPVGDPDRAPVRIGHHSQAFLHAGAEAAVGALMALHHRQMTGQGQQVDVSVQACVAYLLWATSDWDAMKVKPQRGGLRLSDNPALAELKTMWPCRDGYVIWLPWGGLQGKMYWPPLVEWMDGEGMASDFLRGFDWETFDHATATKETVDAIVGPTARFFMAHTKAELLEGAVKHRAMLCPVSTTGETLESAQLAARDFWVEVDHPELGVTMTYPGAFGRFSENAPRISRRAPLIGEHNEEVLREVPRLSGEEVPALRGGRAVQGPSARDDAAYRKPLHGVKVADFSWSVVGPLATKVLADYGAEVVKIEGRSKPDIARITGAFKDGIRGLDRAGRFVPYNTGKLSVALNLAHPRGKDIARRFVSWADVVVETFAAGAMERMGLGYEELKEIKPDIIMLSSSSMGQAGPHAALPTFGAQLVALAGFTHITGWPDREPANLEVYTDFIGPHFNALAILAGLDYRRRTGRGLHLDFAQYENAVHFMAPLILDAAVNKRVAGRVGNRFPDAAPHGAYRCRGEDRWCVVAVFTDREWQSFREVIGSPEWTGDPRFGTLPARKQNEDELDKLVEAWTAGSSPEEVMTVMQSAGVAAGVVQTTEDMLDHDPQLRHRHFHRTLDHPEIGKYRAPEPSFKLSRSPCELRRAPLLGEHNEYALKQILGMSDAEIAELVIEGVIE